MDGTFSLSDKQMKDGAVHLQQKLKTFKNKQEDHSKEAILLQIERSQARKKSIKIHKAINSNQYIDLDVLRGTTWNGIPETMPGQRSQAWKLLLDYIPIDSEQREETLD